MEKVYLIDGMSLVFRAYHAMLKTGMSSPSGQPTGALYGFINLMTALLEKENPENIIVAFDVKQPTFRHKMYPEYKANRPPFPEDLAEQLPKIKEFLTHAGVAQTELPGFEADDVIGTLSYRASQKKIKAICVTADKDYYQLVNDYVVLYKPSRTSRNEFDIVSYPEVEKKFGVTPDKVIDVLALLGDASDNVPGVKGVGVKTAIPLIQKYGTLEELYEHLDEIERKVILTKLERDKEKAFLSKTLVTIDVDCPVTIALEESPLGVPDMDSLNKLFHEAGFTVLRRKWESRASKSTTSASAAEETIIKKLGEVKVDYKLINNEDDFSLMMNGLNKAQILSVDLETSGLDRQRCDIVGIALAAEESIAYYVAVSEHSSDDIAAENQSDQMDMFAPQPEKIKEKSKFTTLDTNWVVGELRHLFESTKLPKCGQNIKFDAFILRRYGATVSPIAFDSMVASYILSADSQHNLDAMALKHLSYEPVSIKTLIGEKKSTQKSMADLDPADISDYACEDADIALKLRNKLYPMLQKENLLELAEKVDFPLIEVLTDVESNGIAIDSAALEDLSALIGNEAAKLTTAIYEEAGSEFNIDSPKQLGHILFEKLMIPPIKKTKTGYSTDVNVLTQLAEIYPIAEYILEYRSLVKIKSTYADALPKLINEKTGRIHTTFNQTVALTGRLSSTEPNLQNIPIRTELGQQIRKAFVPSEKDTVIIAADYSQVELRIMAFYSGDERLSQAFIDGEDVHSATAARLFDVDVSEVTKDQRRKAKTVNFGIMYGLGTFGLAQRLDIPRGEASEIISNYFEKYPKIKQYIDDTINSTREKGYAETLLGRRRYFPEINSPNRNIKTAAERAAINMPIQGSAADMIKLAMINIWKRMKSENIRSKMLLQVHDELVFEVYKDEVERLKIIIKEEAEKALPIGKIPTTIDIGIGSNWLEAH